MDGEGGGRPRHLQRRAHCVFRVFLGFLKDYFRV
jgi:hypothetical protein